MFTFAFIKGVKNGWLNAEEYAPAARKAWIALVSYLNDKNQVREICVGTNKKNSIMTVHAARVIIMGKDLICGVLPL